LLIENGTDVNARNYVKLTPLHYAAAYGNSDLADLLIKNGADVNATDR
jgi:ankyrin repeat protein